MESNATNFTDIKGLIYVENAIDIQTEEHLIHYINSRPWSHVLKRRTQHYGFEYNYSLLKTPLVPATPIPLEFRQLIDKFKLKNIDQIIVNEYQPGQGIAHHIDHPKIFGAQIASLSLQSNIQMDFVNTKNAKNAHVYLKRRSLVILEDEARYAYTHGITARKSDVVSTIRVPRGTRISITFRSLMKK